MDEEVKAAIEALKVYIRTQDATIEDLLKRVAQLEEHSNPLLIRLDRKGQ